MTSIGRQFSHLLFLWKVITTLEVSWINQSKRGVSPTTTSVLPSISTNFAITFCVVVLEKLRSPSKSPRRVVGKVYNCFLTQKARLEACKDDLFSPLPYLLSCIDQVGSLRQVIALFSKIRPAALFFSSLTIHKQNKSLQLGKEKYEPLFFSPASLLL